MVEWKSAVIGAVSGAIASAVVTLITNWGTAGGVAHFVGGVTSKEAEDLIKMRLPSGAIVAFDLQGTCPDGWANRGFIDIWPLPWQPFTLGGPKAPPLERHITCRLKKQSELTEK